jgi:hypothetical protein
MLSDIGDKEVCVMWAMCSALASLLRGRRVGSLVLCLAVLLAWSAAGSDVDVPAGFTVTVFPIGMEVDGLAVSPGGAYGTDLYAAVNGGVIRIDPATGGFTTFVTGLPTGDNRPSGLCFDSGAMGTWGLYVSQNDGSVMYVDSAGNASLFCRRGTLYSSNDLTIAKPGGPFGDYMYVTNGSWLGNSSMSRVNTDGADTLFSPGSSFTGIPIGLDFPGDGSAFGPALFITQADGKVCSVSVDGQVYAVASGLGLAIDLAFGWSRPFGDSLYVSDPVSQSIFRVAADGSAGVFASGLAFTSSGFDADLVFSPEGTVLYVANDDEIIKIAWDGASVNRGPDPVSLAKPFPNPSRGSVAFGISGAHPAVRFSILDITGRRVRSLSVAGSGSTGVILWDGCDAGGAEVASGVYLIAAWDADGLLGCRSVCIVR